MAPAAPMSFASAHGNRLAAPPAARSRALAAGVDSSLRPVSARQFGVLLPDALVRGSQALMHRRALFLDAMGTLVTLRAPVQRLVSVLREARDEASLRTLRARCAAVLWQALPPLPELAGADAETMTGVLLAALRFTAYPDARPLLERVRCAGARAIVVSNWDVSLAEVLDRTGLTPLLDGVIVSAVVGAAKPSPVIFAAALERAGARAEDCVHVGDSLEQDVAGARAAGIEPVLLDRGRGATAPDGVRMITSLDELWP
jgi:HAD superfamily hydrolase (TIGR01549 family)